MRSTDESQDSLFRLLEQRIPASHALRFIREMADAALADLGK